MTQCDESLDREARWRALVARYEPRLMRYVARTRCSRGEAEEIVADVWADALCAEADLTLEMDPWPRLLEVVRRCCAERMRTWRREVLGLSRIVSEAKPDESGIDPEVWKAWWEWVLRPLSKQQRIAVTFRYLWAWRTPDVALALGTSEVTARVHLTRALRRLREVSGQSCARDDVAPGVITPPA